MVAPGAGVRWRGSSTGAPGAGLRIAVAKDLRGQGSRLSTGQAEGGPHAPEEAALVRPKDDVYYVYYNILPPNGPCSSGRL